MNQSAFYIPIHTIVTDFQLRESLDAEWIEHLAEVFDELPPLLVTHDRVLLDGHHRLAAALCLGLTEVLARTVPADDPVARTETAALANHHGLRHTLKERRAIADRLLRDAPEFSDRRIARAAGMSPTTIGTRRRALAAVQLHSSKSPGHPGVQLDTAPVQLDAEAVTSQADPVQMDTAETDRKRASLGRLRIWAVLWRLVSGIRRRWRTRNGRSAT
jgi:ParB-like chromosome segregation protein Spo0J